MVSGSKFQINQILGKKILEKLGNKKFWKNFGNKNYINIYKGTVEKLEKFGSAAVDIGRKRRTYK